MGMDIDFFFNIENELESTEVLVEKLNENIGLNLKYKEDDLWDGVLKGLYLTFHENYGLENDQGINFEKYKYNIGIYGPANAGCLREIMVSEVLNLAYSICYILKTYGMVVYNLESKICELGYKDERIFDLIEVEEINLLSYYIWND